jgi:hypothetical protein
MTKNLSPKNLCARAVNHECDLGVGNEFLPRGPTGKTSRAFAREREALPSCRRNRRTEAEQTTRVGNDDQARGPMNGWSSPGDEENRCSAKGLEPRLKSEKQDRWLGLAWR